MAFRRRARRNADPPFGVGPSGRPLVTVADFDSAPDEIVAQARLDGELLRIVPGVDRPDYWLVVLDRPLGFHLPPDVHAWCRAVVVVAHLVGERVTPGVRDLAVNVALVLDDTALREEVLDFAKVLPVGIASFSHRDAPAPAPLPALTTQDRYSIYVRIAQTLRDDLEASRAEPIERLDVTLDFDDQQRVESVTGTADSVPVILDPAALERIDADAARFTALGPGERPRRLSVHIDGSRVSFDVG